MTTKIKKLLEVLIYSILFVCYIVYFKVELLATSDWLLAFAGFTLIMLSITVLYAIFISYLQSKNSNYVVDNNSVKEEDHPWMMFAVKKIVSFFYNDYSKNEKGVHEADMDYLFAPTMFHKTIIFVLVFGVALVVFVYAVAPMLINFIKGV